jgi:hypothetical protein
MIISYKDNDNLGHASPSDPSVNCGWDGIVIRTKNQAVGAGKADSKLAVAIPFQRMWVPGRQLQHVAGCLEIGAPRRHFSGAIGAKLSGSAARIEAQFLQFCVLVRYVHRLGFVKICTPIRCTRPTWRSSIFVEVRACSTRRHKLAGEPTRHCRFSAASVPEAELPVSSPRSSSAPFLLPVVLPPEPPTWPQPSRAAVIHAPRYQKRRRAVENCLSGYTRRDPEFQPHKPTHQGTSADKRPLTQRADI